MVHISDNIYEHIVQFLRVQGCYWSGGMGGDYWVFNASIIINDNDLIPVWYEFRTDYPDNQNNDFSFDKLKEFYKQ